jgi:short-subunit dehydrogenase
VKLSAARVLVTGAAGGIGSAIAAELLAAGAAVMLADVRESALAAAASRLGGRSDRLASCAANLAEPAGRSALCAAAVAWRVNVLVNNAGVSHFGLHDELGPARLAQTIAINVLAPLALVQDLLPHLEAQPEAHVLNMGSVFGSIGYPGYAAYSASKFAIRGFSEALRRELADSTVRVHHLSPRATRTPINSTAVEQMNAELKVAMDSPERVAREARRVLERGLDSAVVGWPEKLFARLNALAPRLVDGAIAKQLPIIRRYARESAQGSIIENNPRRQTT